MGFDIFFKPGFHMAKVETKTTAEAAQREVQIPRRGNENGAGITGLLRSLVQINRSSSCESPGTRTIKTSSANARGWPY